MYKIRPKEQRGLTKVSWLESYHTFSFIEYFDPRHMGFSDMRVLNEITIAPQMGFKLHRNNNAEIILIVLDGALEYEDGLGNKAMLEPGIIEKISSGKGIMHSEHNRSSTDPVRFLVIYILPDEHDAEPSSETKTFAKEEMQNKFLLVASGEAKENLINVKQDVEIFQAYLNAGKIIQYELNEKRAYWIQIAQGAVEVNSKILKAGDGLSITGEKDMIEIKGLAEKSNIVLLNLREIIEPDNPFEILKSMFTLLI